MMKVKGLCMQVGENMVMADELTFYPSSFYLLKGESGSGKTKLIYRLGLISHEKKGQFYVNGVLLGAKEKERMQRNEIGILYQNFNLNDDLSLYEHLSIFAAFQDKKMAVEEGKDLLKKVRLTLDLNRKFSTLSGGEKQRFCLACLLAKNPSVIIADEPTSALDEENANVLMDLLYQLAKEDQKIVIVSTHSQRFDRLADSIISIHSSYITQTKENKKENQLVLSKKSNWSQPLIVQLMGYQLRRLLKVSKFSILLSICILSFSVFFVQYGKQSVQEYQTILQEHLSKNMFLIQVNENPQITQFIEMMPEVVSYGEIMKTVGTLKDEKREVEIYTARCVDEIQGDYLFEKPTSIQIGISEMNLKADRFLSYDEASCYGDVSIPKIILPSSYLKDVPLERTGNYLLELNYFSQFPQVEQRLMRICQDVEVRSPYLYYSSLLETAKLNEIFLQVACLLLTVVSFVVLGLVQYHELKEQKKILCMYQGNGLCRKEVLLIKMGELFIKCLGMTLACSLLCFLLNKIGNVVLLKEVKLIYHFSYVIHILMMVGMDIVVPHLLFTMLLLKNDIEAELRQNNE